VRKRQAIAFSAAQTAITMRPDAPPFDPDAQQRQLGEALHRPACYPHPVGEVRLIETHISRVLLTGEFA